MKLRHIHYTDDIERSLINDLYDSEDSIIYAQDTCAAIRPLITNKMIENEDFVKYLDLVRERLHIADTQLDAIQKNVLALINKESNEQNNQSPLSSPNGEATASTKK
jgi:hypothetical protein